MIYVWQLPDWPNFQVNFQQIQALLLEQEQAGIALSQAFSRAGMEEKTEVLLNNLADEAIGTFAIEGEELSRESVRSSLIQQLSGSTGTGNDPQADGVAKLILSVRNSFNDELTDEELCNWQSLVVSQRIYGDPITIGSYRKGPMEVVSGPIHRQTIHYVGPPPESVQSEMKSFLDWYNGPVSRTSFPGIIRAAVAHAWLELVHPFDDGNGRVGRAIAEHALCQDLGGIPVYSISKVLEANRSSYYDSLSKANTSLDLTSWVGWFVSSVSMAQKQSALVINHVMAKTAFWDQLHSHELNARQVKVINKMFDAGPEGFEGGMSTDKYAKITRASKATAARDLQQLRDIGAFLVTGDGRSTRYHLNLTGKASESALEKLVRKAEAGSYKGPSR